ncbi:MAG TPA: SigE family RNA polymerase sigma factor [Nocardioides sp.]|nr:SigE family RNA polymerase sigma factor [Nocardioides sp.]
MALPGVAGVRPAAYVVTERSDARPVVAAVDNGADAGIERLYLDHWDRLVRLSVLLVRDQGAAEEIVQDAFVAVHQRWDRLDDHERALAYLRQAIVNRSRSALRHRAVVQRYLSRQSLPDPAPASDEPVLGDARRQLVLDALRQLPRRQREVLALRYYLDMTEAQIAETLGISKGAVKSHASRGSAALRPILDGLGPDVRGGA